jgi:hypothetical protein
MTALSATTAAPAPSTDPVRTNNRDAAYAGQLSAAGQAAIAAATRPLGVHDAHVARAHRSRLPPGRQPKRTGRWAWRAAEEPDAERHRNHADREPPARLSLPTMDTRAQADGNARPLLSTVSHRRLSVQLNT